MKHLLLSAAVCFTLSLPGFAQSAPLDVAKPVSKAEYAAKVKDLDHAITDGNTEAAEKLFGEVNTLVNDEMKVIRYKERDAANEDVRAKYRAVVKQQRGLFSEVMNLKRGDMAANRAQMIEKLNAFGETIE